MKLSYILDSLHVNENISKVFFVSILMIRAYSSRWSKIQYLKILKYLLRSIKKKICRTENLKFFKVCSFLHSTLGRGSFSTNWASVKSGMEAVSLRHYWDSSLSVLLDPLFLFFLLEIYPTIQMGFRSGMLAGQSSTVISWSANHLEVVLSVWAGPKVLLENEISILIKLVSRWKHKVLQNRLVDGCIDFGRDKTQDQHQQMSRQPKSSQTVKLHTGLQATWILCLSSLPPDSETLIYKWNATFTFIWKEDFGSLSNSPVIFLLIPGKMLLTMFLFQKWLGSSFPEDVWAWWLLIQLQFTPCEALPSVWIGFAWQYSQACGHLCSLCTFSTHFLPSSQLCI